jgi:hypothetical protein
LTLTRNLISGRSNPTTLLHGLGLVKDSIRFKVPNERRRWAAVLCWALGVAEGPLRAGIRWASRGVVGDESPAGGIGWEFLSGSNP